MTSQNKRIDPSEVRECTVSIGSPGGNASKGSQYFRVTIPPKWAKALGISREERSLQMSFDGETILLRKTPTED